MDTEPKKDVDDLVDEYLDKSGEEKPEDSSPQNDQQDKSQEGESDSQKTLSTDKGSEDEKTDESVDKSTDDSDNLDSAPKGFADHPKWQKIIEKRKQAEERLKEIESKQKEYESLLNDPDVYERYLKRQGISEYEVQERMRQKGFNVKKEAGDPLFDRVAKKLGWDKSKLNAEQINHINDLITLNQAVADEIVQEKIKPVESYISQARNTQRIDQRINKAKALAEKDNISWDVAEKMMYEELQKRDEELGYEANIDPVDLYLLSTRGYVAKSGASSQKKEQHNSKLDRLRPLGSTNAINTEKKKNYSNQSVDKIVDDFLDGVGYRE